MTPVSYISSDEFAGMGPSWDDEKESADKEMNNSMMAAAMEIISNPELHNKNLAAHQVRRPVSVRCKIYDLSNTRHRKAYEKDLLHILSSDTTLLLDRGKKQFMQTQDSCKYVTYLEWAEYVAHKPKKDK